MKHEIHSSKEEEEDVRLDVEIWKEEDELFWVYLEVTSSNQFIKICSHSTNTENEYIILPPLNSIDGSVGDDDRVVGYQEGKYGLKYSVDHIKVVNNHFFEQDCCWLFAKKEYDIDQRMNGNILIELKSFDEENTSHLTTVKSFDWLSLPPQLFRSITGVDVFETFLVVNGFENCQSFVHIYPYQITNNEHVKQEEEDILESFQLNESVTMIIFNPICLEKVLMTNSQILSTPPTSIQPTPMNVDLIQDEEIMDDGEMAMGEISTQYNVEYDLKSIRFSFQSPIQPKLILSFDIQTQELDVLKSQIVEV